MTLKDPRKLSAVFAALAALSLPPSPALAASPPPVSADIKAASAHWLQRDLLAWDVKPGAQVELHYSRTAELEWDATGLQGGASISLQAAGRLSGEAAQHVPHLEGLPLFRLPPGYHQRVPELLKAQVVLVARSDTGEPQRVGGVQTAHVLDALFAHDGPLGVTFNAGAPTFRLWAPTAQSVRLWLFDGPESTQPLQVLDMQENAATGTWALQGRAGWDRKYYLYEVEVYVRSTQRVEKNLVTDPYSHALSLDSKRSQIVDLTDPDLLPDGWNGLHKPPLAAPEDIVLYELHVRDFSIHDETVPQAQRGKFLAFTDMGSAGMDHLQGLARAGLTHLHLLPAFDCATIPEDPQDQLPVPDLSGWSGDSPRQQQAIDAVRARDAFNWCYDPYHYTVPEGSYASEPNGVERVREFREMVAALNRAGLRVVMDVVYNHTTSSGQAPKSVLDRIVPDYYQRLDGIGRVETSTCCANTATEHRMMEKLMLDSLLTWAVQYKVDAFRFDLMGHHSKANILKVRDALRSLTLEEHGVDGGAIYLYGEGWNFGEVADDARFVQATQSHMGRQTGIGTFNDRMRDAVRGGAHDDRGIAHVRKQGLVNGLFYAPNAENSGSEEERARLLHAADLVRVGLAGSLADFTLVDRFGDTVKASEIGYHGQPAGYTSDPQEVINYVAAHDNETLFDINQYKLPPDTSMEDRVRVVNLANSIVAFAQGVPFYHAGQDLLRSKSLDRNSFDSGDWFNLLDFTYRANGWARGLPPRWDNEANWSVAAPLLSRSDMAPTREHIQAASKHLQEVLEIRRATALLRQRDADSIRNSLRFHNTGPNQIPGLIVMSLRSVANERVVVLLNATAVEQRFTVAGTQEYRLHPVLRRSADPVVRSARFDAGEDGFLVPARTAAVFISQPSRPDP